MAGTVRILSIDGGVISATLPWPEVRDWGPRRWMEHGALMDVLFEASSAGAHMLNATRGPRTSFRFQLRLPPGSGGTDNVDPANIRAFQDATAAALAGGTEIVGDPDHGGVRWPEQLAAVLRALDVAPVAVSSGG